MRKLPILLIIMVSLAAAQQADVTQDPAAGAGTTGETGTETSEAPVGCMGAGGGITGLLPIVGMIAIFYFLIIRPQQKQQKMLREMRGNLQKGDRVVTSGGIHGVISNLRNDVVTLKIAEGVKIEVDRNALTLLGTEHQDQEGQ